MNLGRSSGILVRETRSGHTHSTSIISRIFCGSRIRSTWSLPGEHFSRWRITVLFLSAPHSADGTLSVMDVRSKKAEPIAQSEDQEDELLSIVGIKG